MPRQSFNASARGPIGAVLLLLIGLIALLSAANPLFAAAPFAPAASHTPSAASPEERHVL